MKAKKKKDFSQNKTADAKNKKHITSISCWIQTNRSTVDAISSLVEEIRQDWNNQTIETQCTFLDLRKAFDTVDHKLLSNKCNDYGTEGPAYDILVSYLSERKQFVSINRLKSQSKKIFRSPIGLNSRTSVFHSV